jgi:hypothetical protein
MDLVDELEEVGDDEDRILGQKLSRIIPSADLAPHNLRII